MIEKQKLREQIKQIILANQKRISKVRLNKLVEGYYQMFIKNPIGKA